MKDNKIIKIVISWLLVIIWMCFIFYMSNMNSDNSSNVSEGLTQKIVETSFEVGNSIGIVDKPSKNEINNIVSDMHVPIRKVAHFTEYLILALLLYNALLVSGVKKYLIIYILLICIIYASFDEIHQIFISGRAGRIFDILIDTFGSLVGIFISKKILQK